MDDDVKFMGVGAYLYGALSLAGIFAAGLVFGSKVSAMMVIVAAAAAYFSQIFGANAAAAGKGEKAAFALMVVSIIAGMTGFVALIWS